MGLFAALRDRLFGPPAAPAGPDDTAAGPAESASDPGELAPDPAEASAGPVESASSDVAMGEAMPQGYVDQSPERDPGSDDAVATRQERLASQILEDERLRGDLTDDEFQPLLNWALTAADRLAASTAGLPDEQADRRIDTGLSAIRESVAAAADAIAAYAERDADRLRRALAEAGLGARDQQTDSAIARLMIERDLPGSEVASLIAGRLGEVTADASSLPGKASS
jgi:hypothetical protein